MLIDSMLHFLQEQGVDVDDIAERKFLKKKLIFKIFKA